MSVALRKGYISFDAQCMNKMSTAVCKQLHSNIPCNVCFTHCILPIIMYLKLNVMISVGLK